MQSRYFSLIKSRCEENSTKIDHLVVDAQKRNLAASPSNALRWNPDLFLKLKLTALPLFSSTNFFNSPFRSLVKNSVMDANREKELAELKDSIKKAEARRQMYEESKHLDMAMKIQDEINKLMDKELILMKQQGESQPPAHAANFCCHAW